MPRNPQRTNNYWEVIYDPKINALDDFKPKDNELVILKYWRNLIIDINDFRQKPYHFNSKVFECIDFIGSLDGESTITFEGCTFEKVSFRNSVFNKVKFRRCFFVETSFSLSHFVDCEFRDCDFKRISVSGNTTILENTYIDSRAFLFDVYLNKNKDVLRVNNSSLPWQRYNYYKTKSVLARKIMKLRPVVNDLELLILSIKVARCLEIKSSIYKSFYFMQKEGCFKKNLWFFNFVFSVIEYLVVNVFGWLTGWGYKIGKTVFFGLFLSFLFSLLYDQFFYINADYFENLLRALEYGFLFGYTKYPFKDISNDVQWVHFLNSFFGMMWFSALIPVILNKMSNDDK